MGKKNQESSMSVVCPTCGGRGMTTQAKASNIGSEYADKTCGNCGGSGWVASPR